MMVTREQFETSACKLWTTMIEGGPTRGRQRREGSDSPRRGALRCLAEIEGRTLAWSEGWSFIRKNGIGHRNMAMRTRDRVAMAAV